MTDDRPTLVVRFLQSVRTSWNEYNDARRDGDMEKMKKEFDYMVKVLRILHRSGYAAAVSAFLRETEGMPVRAILKRFAK